jgi:hypothetical protein
MLQGRQGATIAAIMRRPAGSSTRSAASLPAWCASHIASMANHASTRTTQLYDRRRDEVSLDEVERISI